MGGRGVSAGTKALSSDVGKRLTDEGIKHVRDLYRFGTSKIKNENLERQLNLMLLIILLKKHRKRQMKTL